MPLGLLRTDCMTLGRDDDQDTLAVIECSAAQDEALHALAVHIWNSGLPSEAAEARYRKQLKLPLMRKRRTFVLVPRNDPETTNILGGISLMKLELLVVRPGRSQADHKQAYLVDDAVIRPKWRGRNYAALMSHMLFELLKQSDDLPWALIGFSDCGTTIWSSVHGQAAPAHTVVIDTDDWAKDADELARLVEPQAEALTLQQIQDFAAHDVEKMKERLLATSPGLTRFAVVPTGDLYQCYIQWVTEPIVSSRGADRIPQIFGCRIEDAYAYFTYDVADCRLHVIRFVCSTVAEASVLLSAVAEHAAWWGMHKIEIWDVDKDLIAALDLPVIERDMNIPMFMPCGARPGSTVQWACAEKFSMAIPL